MVSRPMTVSTAIRMTFHASRRNISFIGPERVFDAIKGQNPIRNRAFHFYFGSDSGAWQVYTGIGRTNYPVGCAFFGGAAQRTWRASVSRSISLSSDRCISQPLNE